MSLCAITELPPAMCAHCRGLTSVQEQAAAEIARDPRWLTAHYGGTCACCGEPFEAGTLIRLDTGTQARGFWRGECCAGVA